MLFVLDRGQVAKGRGPAGGVIPAVEGLKTIACYQYQTADDQERWKGSVPEAFCRSLEMRLIGLLPGFDEAPWGWQIPDLDAKADRVRVAARDQQTSDPAPTDLDVARAVELLITNGIELEPHPDVDNDLPAGVYVPIDRDFQAQPSRKVGHWSSANHLNRGQVHVRAYADAAAAHVGYLLRRAVHEHVTESGLIGWTRWVARHGRLVVDLARHPGSPGLAPASTGFTYTTLQQQKDALAMLGHPDESWSTDDLPIIADVEGGSVVCQGLALPNGYGGRGIQVITESEDLQRLSMLVEHPHDRQKILDIDPETHTALVIHGVASADRIAHTRVQELASPPGADPKYLLDMTVEGLRWTSAVVVAVDKLPHRPTEAVLRHPGAGDSPTPFGVYG